jgi:two-component system, sensor histidine kinase and response regulator
VFNLRRILDIGVFGHTPHNLAKRTRLLNGFCLFTIVVCVAAAFFNGNIILSTGGQQNVSGLVLDVILIATAGLGLYLTSISRYELATSLVVVGYVGGITFACLMRESRVSGLMFLVPFVVPIAFFDRKVPILLLSSLSVVAFVAVQILLGVDYVTGTGEPDPEVARFYFIMVVMAVALAIIFTVMKLENLYNENLLARERDISNAARAAKSTFLANMSHEIRSPLNAIIGLTNLTLKSQLTPIQRDYLSKVDVAAGSLHALINDILDFSKIEAGKLSVESIEFSLNELLDNQVSVSDVRAAEKGVEFVIDRDLRVPDTLIGDPLRLGQIITNLTSNAIKFTDQGRVTLTVKALSHAEDSTTINVCVEDSGIGIDPHQLTKLSEPFTQADDSTTREYGGTGLGLSITQELLEMMGSKLEVSSVVGAGSKFSFAVTLPATVASTRLAEKLLRMKVLLVRSSRESTLDRMLSSLNYEFDVLRDPADIDAVLEQTRYDVVLSEDPELPVARLENISPKVVRVVAEASVNTEDQTIVEIVRPVNLSLLFDAIARSFGFSGSSSHRRRRADLSKEHARISHARVLLVDDAEVNRLVAAELLKEIPLVVETATNGIESIKMAEQGDYDCVLMDVHMPLMDGFEATRQLRAAGINIPIIALTADAMPEDAKAAISAGMNDHIAKPIDPNDLFSKLLKWIPEGNRQSVLEPSEAPEVDSRFEEHLPGINVAEGVTRVANNHELYLSIVDTFLGGHRQAPETLNEFFEKSEFENAKDYAHKISGVAANLGMSDLAEAASQIQKSAAELTVSDLQELTHYLDEVIASVDILKTRG